MNRFFQKFFGTMMVVNIVGSLSVGTAFAQANNDSLTNENLNFHEKVVGFEERLDAAEDKLAERTKIRLSGYIQAQWLHFENPAIYPNNTFMLRRARFKLKYQPVEGVIFVLSPDFNTAKIVLKDAYVALHDPWLKIFSLWAGQFNRPNFEVEYSSSKREVPERSRIIRRLYPGERGIGAKLEVNPPNTALKIQLAVLNGNTFYIIDDIYGENINLWALDFDPFKDIVARLTYGFKLGNFGKLNIGASAYYGWQKSNSTTVLKSDYTLDKNIAVGQSVDRQWFGGEFQLYMDVLGGMEIRAEYLMGVNAYPGAVGSFTIEDPMQISLANDTLSMTSMITNTDEVNPTIRRNFIGGYVYLIKNIGKRNQFAFRWDFYDPNTKLSGNQIGVVGYDASTSDIQTTTTIDGTNPVVVLNEITENITDNSRKGNQDSIL